MFCKEPLCGTGFDLSNNQAKFHAVGWVKDEMHMFRHNDIAKYFELMLHSSKVKKVNQDLLCPVIGKAWQVSVTIEGYKTRGIEIIKVPQSGHSQI